MGVVRIQDLTAATTPLAGTEIVEIEQGGNSRKVAVSEFGGGAAPVQEEGVTVVAAPTAINFVGAGVTATASGTVATVTIPGGGGGGSTYHTALSGTRDGVFFMDGTFLRVSRQPGGTNPALINSPKSAGLWYMEFFINAIGSGVPTPGLSQTAATNGDVGVSAPTSSFTGGWSILSNNGSKYSGSVSGYGSAVTTGDVVMMAVNLNTGKIWMGKNNTWFASGDPAAGTNEMFSTVTGFVTPAVGLASNSDFTFRLKAADQSYSPPSGFSAWDS